MKPLAYIIWVKYHFPMKKTVFASVMLFVSAAMLSAVSLTLSDGSIIEGNVTGIDGDKAEVVFMLPLSMIEDNQWQKPEKIVPPYPDSFVLIQGGAVSAPIDTAKLENAFRRGLVSHGYRVLSSEPGVITYGLDNGRISLTMRFCYAPDEYWYEYVDSTGLDADIQRNYIHRRYSRWINILEKEISEGYYL